METHWPCCTDSGPQSTPPCPAHPLGESIGLGCRRSHRTETKWPRQLRGIPHCCRLTPAGWGSKCLPATAPWCGRGGGGAVVWVGRGRGSVWAGRRGGGVGGEREGEGRWIACTGSHLPLSHHDMALGDVDTFQTVSRRLEEHGQTILQTCPVHTKCSASAHTRPTPPSHPFTLPRPTLSSLHLALSHPFIPPPHPSLASVAGCSSASPHQGKPGLDTVHGV